MEAGIEPTTFRAPPYVCYGKARALPTELPPPVRATFSRFVLHRLVRSNLFELYVLERSVHIAGLQ
jgi:hypothetical protein